MLNATHIAIVIILLTEQIVLGQTLLVVHIIFIHFLSPEIMPLDIYDFGEDTETHRHLHKSDFKKPGVHWP